MAAFKQDCDLLNKTAYLLFFVTICKFLFNLFQSKRAVNTVPTLLPSVSTGICVSCVSLVARAMNSSTRVSCVSLLSHVWLTFRVCHYYIVR